MSKYKDWLGIATGALGFIATVATIFINLLGQDKDPNMLHSYSAAAFLLFVLSLLWLFFKSSVTENWKRASLIILYIFSAFYFVWAGTWLFDRKIESSSEPLPTAQIMEPKNGAVIEMFTPFLLEYANIPTSSYLWVVVQLPSYDKVYLWDNDEFQNKQNKDGAISSTMQVGATTSVGHVYNIIVLLVDEKVNFSFQEYRKQCEKIGQCDPIILPETGIQVLDFSTVTRK